MSLKKPRESSLSGSLERKAEMINDKFENYRLLAPHCDRGEDVEQPAETVEIDDVEALRVAEEILDRYIDAFLELAK